MNASLLLLSSAMLASANPVPIVVQGQGCTNCGSADAPVYGSPTFASASFGSAACGSCGGGRVSLLDRLRSRFGGSSVGCGVSASGCGMSDCGLTVAAPACGAPACGSPLRSSFVASHTATAAPSCCGPVVRSAFPVASAAACDPAPTAGRTGLFSRLRARLSGGGCGTPVYAPACNGCTGSVGTVYSSPGTTVPSAMPAPSYMPAPAAMPAPAPVAMPMPPAGSTVPKNLPPVETPKPKDVKDKTGARPAPVVPLSPSDLPRIPTLNGLGD